MSIPDRVSPDQELPEQRLLRNGDRMQDYAGAFLRGDITAQQYSELTLAEINRRAPLDPLLPLGDPDVPPAFEPVAFEPPVFEVVSPDLAEPLPLDVVDLEDGPIDAETTEAERPRHVDADRATVLAHAFVTGRIRGSDFLRLIRDC